MTTQSSRMRPATFAVVVIHLAMQCCFTAAMTTLSPPATTSQHTPDHGGGVLQYMASHVWLPILIGLVFLVAVGVLIYAIIRLRHRARYDYTALNEDLALPEKIERAKLRETEQIRDTALLNCSFYLRSSGKYTLIDHLPDIGSRVKRHWFWLRHNQHRTEHLLTMAPPGTTPTDALSQRAISDLLNLLQHPYLERIQEIDLLALQDRVSVVQPYCRTGSLKDIIHACYFSDSWLDKYLFKGKHLPISQIQLFGKQILEALIYLDDKGFPKFCHLHTGNILVENFTCRLTGYDNVLLGYNFKLQPLLRRKLKDNFKAVDSLCFGHVLFEMATGFELDSAHPGAKHMVHITDVGLAEVLNFIFVNPKGYPSILDIYQLDFFQAVHLKEMEDYDDTPERIPSHIKTFLKALRKSQRDMRKNGKTKGSEGKASGPATIKMEVELQPRKSPVPDQKALNPQSPQPTPTDGHQQQGKSRRKSSSAKVKTSGKEVPPPPAAPSFDNPDVAVHQPAGSEGRGALLADIRKGLTLKKTQTVDKSQPRV